MTVLEPVVLVSDDITESLQDHGYVVDDELQGSNGTLNLFCLTVASS